MTPHAAIEVRGLAKRFGTLQALDHIDLRIEQGEFFGLLGPNGAGKTTLISLIAGLARPDAGVARVMGHAVVTDYRAARRALGALGVLAGIWAEKIDQLSAFQNFVVVPATFLSGVFYSVKSLSPGWRDMSMMNPFFFMIDGFRYGFFRQSDVAPLTSLVAVLAALMMLAAIVLVLLRSGCRMRA